MDKGVFTSNINCLIQPSWDENDYGTEISN